MVAFAVAGCGAKQDAATPVQSGESAAAPAAEPSAPQYTVAQVSGSTIEGRVLFQGMAPAPKKFQVTQDGDVCGKTREVPVVELKNGGLEDAVVWIDDIQQGKPFAFPAAEVQQKKCSYMPHVVLMQPGDLKIVSGDSIPHNVHTYAQNNHDFNESMNPLRREISVSFRRPDIVSLRCDLHGWMQAYVVVAKNPYYAVTQNGGKFQLDQVPPGRYHLKLWTESQGEAQQEIAVEAGKPTQVEFQLRSSKQTAKAGLP